MTQVSGRDRLFTTAEFDKWWEARGRAKALQTAFDAETAKPLAWDAWRAGRERLMEATAADHLQPARR